MDQSWGALQVCFNRRWGVVQNYFDSINVVCHQLGFSNSGIYYIPVQCISAVCMLHTTGDQAPLLILYWENCVSETFNVDSENDQDPGSYLFIYTYYA